MTTATFYNVKNNVNSYKGFPVIIRRVDWAGGYARIFGQICGVSGDDLIIKTGKFSIFANYREVETTTI